MRAVVQRVARANVSVDGKAFSSIEKGLLIFLGIRNGDEETDARYLAEKCAALRIFSAIGGSAAGGEDAHQKMNLSVVDVGGSVLVVSQFTLYGDAQRGNRPSFVEAAPPSVAEPLYEFFVGRLRQVLGIENVATGIFRAMMEVELVNDGPVTIILESKR